MKLTEHDFPLRSHGRKVITSKGRVALSVRNARTAQLFAERMNHMGSRLLVR